MNDNSQDLEEHLQHGEISVSGRLVDASNATLFGTSLYNGEEVSIIYKPIAGERPLWDFADGNLASREYASYLVSELAGWGVVPRTVVADGPFGPGMVQEWIEIDNSIDLATFYRLDDARLRKIALFDAVVNNTDRKIGHILPTEDGKVFGCDHGVTFHEEDKLRTVLWQWASTPFKEDELAQLQSLYAQLDKRDTQIANLITANEYRALLSRIERLLSIKSFPVPSQDWPAVPWPPF